MLESAQSRVIPKQRRAFLNKSHKVEDSNQTIGATADI
jgi:hypothetical protein